MRYFIVHTTPKLFVEKYRSSISGCNFSYNLKDAGLFDTTYSILPTNIYGYEEDPNVDDIHVVYSSLRSKTQFSRIIGCFIEQCRLFRIIKKDSSVWLYNVCVLNLLLFVLLKLFKRSVNVYVIVADFTPGHDWYSRFCLYLINKSDGLITLSNSSLFTVNRLKILPGIVPIDKSYPLIKEPISRSFLLSGALRESIASISSVLNAFKHLPGALLYVSGRGEEENLAQGASITHKNIIFHGVLSYDDFNDLLNNSSFILSTRNPSFPENQCNFPSKILEALLHNRIIISTIHYPQLQGVKYFEVPCEQEDFKNAIEQILSLSDDKLMEYANQGETVKQLFSPEVWKKEIKKIEINYGK